MPRLARRTGPALLALSLALGAAPAAAAVLESGQLSITMPWEEACSGFPSVECPIVGLSVDAKPAGVALTAGGALTFPGGSVAAGTPAFTGTSATRPRDVHPLTTVALSVTGNAAASLQPGAGAPSNGLGLRGALDVVGYGGGVTLIQVPLTPVGAPGATFQTLTPQGGRVELTGAGWTTGSVMITQPTTTLDGATTTFDADHPKTETFAGTNMLTGGVGQITLVSPTLVRTNLAGDLPMGASMTLQFVPEPASLALLGAGVAALAAAGQRRAGRTRAELRRRG